MKTFILAAALTGLAAAQQVDFAAVAAAPAPAVTEAPSGADSQGDVTYNPDPESISSGVEPTAAPAAKMFKRTDTHACEKQPDGTAPNTWPDTADAFKKNPYWWFQANSFPSSISTSKSTYKEKFRNKDGSTQQNSYLTFYILDSYSPAKCAAKCDAVDLCTAFNIYVERSPSLNPAPACPNPKSVAYYKCALWGSAVSAETATNRGQHREKFEVVIAGSNGYDKTESTKPSKCPGFDLDLSLSGKAITLAKNFLYLGSEFFPGPYDPNLCGYYATAQTIANKEDAKSKGLTSYQPCNAFNAFYVYKNKIAQGTYCSLYNKKVGLEAVGNPAKSYNGDAYTVGSSYTFALSEQDAGQL